MHRRREENHGETTDPRDRRFWAKVNKDGPVPKARPDLGPCWIWTGYVSPENGYGQFMVRNGTRLPHRIAYEYLVGPIPKGLVLDHLCHTADPTCRAVAECPHRRCCNPAHTEPVTPRTNIARGNGGDSWGYVPDPLPPKPAKLPKPDSCTEDDGECGNPIYKRTICRKHYRRWLRDPSVERPSQRTPEQRFWVKVDKDGPLPPSVPNLGACWVWTAGINPGTGYGQFAPKHGTQTGAHRFSFELANGSIPDGFEVHHKCFVRRCVRPEHLEALTRADNLKQRENRRQ